MSKVHQQLANHTARISAHVVLKDGEHVANIVLAHPKEGFGRLFAYAHWIGTEMVRGSATGYRYNKSTAALANAANKRLARWSQIGASVDECMFWKHLAIDNDTEWFSQLRDMGFIVISPC